MTIYMMDAPRTRESIEEVFLLNWMYKNDIKHWIIAKETGNDGYKHWQVRLESRYDWDRMKAEMGSKWHIEEAKTDDYEYERKEGNFIDSWDTLDTLQARFGNKRPNQQRIIENLRTQSDRQIDVIIDHEGNTGKTWLARHLYQRRQGFYVPPTLRDGKQIIQFVASGYNKEPIIVVDIARSTHWDSELYVALETIKDGLVYDSRYSHRQRDIHGVKVLVTCNERPVLKRLSADRWRLFNNLGEPLL